MPITPRDFNARLLRADGERPAGATLRAMLAQKEPRQWRLLIDLDGRYAVLSVEQLNQLTTPDDPRPLRALALTPSPTIEAHEDLSAALALLGATGYVVVLRDGAPWGVRMARGQAVLGDDGQPPALPQPKGPVEPLDQHRRSDRYVNTDFATLATPGEPLARTAALTPGERYYFRLHIGEPEATSLGGPEDAPLPEFLLGQDIELTVVLFSEDFGLEDAAGALRVPAAGAARVLRQPAGAGALDAALAEERLLFRVRAPGRSGRAELRCNLYCNGMLVQSRLVAAVVGDGAALDERGAMQRATLDYNLSASLAPELLGQIAPHRLSVMLNTSGEGGTHSFRLFAPGAEGKQLYANSATLSQSKIANLIELTRRRLRGVAWGSEEEYTPESIYRYRPEAPPEERERSFREDLIRLAKRGAQQYDAIIEDLAAGEDAADELRELMRAPGQLQLASKISADDVMPIAMIYDYRLDIFGDLTICAAFEESLASGRPLVDEPCFRGECPHREDLTVVCPSGFWGFRHDIGMPFPVPADGPELALELSCAGAPLIDVAFFEDFPQVKPHLERLGNLAPGAEARVERAATRGDAFALFKRTEPQVVYFYCHGVEQDTIPLLRVGGENSRDYIDTSNFRNFGIKWPDTRPLVFINGCHTAALSPNKALDFVRTFVGRTQASGVIGTEITIFEPLAQTFAETFLAHFLAGTPLGRAFRLGRLELLRQKNPLGLVFLPYAPAGLRLRRAG